MKDRWNCLISKANLSRYTLGGVMAMACVAATGTGSLLFEDIMFVAT